MSRKKRKKKPVAQIPTPEAVSTPAAESESPVEVKPESTTENKDVYALWFTTVYTGNRVYAVVELDAENCEKAIDLIDVRLPRFPNVRRGDFTKEEVSAILSRPVLDNDCIRYSSEGSAVSALSELFENEMKGLRERYGSIEAARKLLMYGNLETFRIEGVSA